MDVATVMVIVLASSLGSAILTGVAVYLIFVHKVSPVLDKKMEEIKAVAETLESRVSAGVREGIRNSIKELPATTMKDTTRTVVKMGSEFVEGGFASLFKDRGV
ncbi:MAG: hypothetical protein H7A00_09610 [Hahellaceae bacterium]|nr:hypothetical protein [Hahellaceae bacterium]